MAKYNVLSSEWLGEGTHRVIVESPFHGDFDTIRQGVRRAALRSDPMGMAVRAHVDGPIEHTGRDAYGNPTGMTWVAVTYRSRY